MKNLNTIKKNSEFQEIKKVKRSWASHSVILSVSKKKEQDAFRVGFIISKKVSKKAVIRNRIKRRFREAVLEIITKYGDPNYDYVLIGRLHAYDCPFNEIKRDLKYCLKKLQVTKN